MLNARFMAKLNPDPVIFSTYKPTAKLYTAVPNWDVKLAVENKRKFTDSLLLKDLFKYFSDNNISTFPS